MTLVYLVGARASGKTTLGKALALRLRLPFADTDAQIMQDAGCSVAKIVSGEGWPGFRRRECAALLALTDHHADTGAVIATGGGMVLHQDNRRLMRERGTVFYLSAPPEALVARLRARPLAQQRPSLTGRNLEDEVRETLELRRPLYEESAHHIIDAMEPPDRLCAQILSILADGRHS